MTESTVRTSDGVTLHLGDSGGEGPPVVLLAGYGAPATSWVFQVDGLTAAGHRAICLDRRSHGRSEAPAFGHRMARHGKDLRDALDQLGLGTPDAPVTLVGGSMGANVIWAYVDLFGTAGIRGIVTVDQTPTMVNTADWPYGFYGLTPENLGTFFADGVPKTGRGFTDEQATPALVRLIERLGPDAVPAQPVGTEALLADHARQDWRDVVARTTIPVLMVAGRQSQLWPCEHAAAALRDTPRGRALVLEDCGHAANLDRPEEFTAALLEFLEEL
ncbi:alpha/beta hydrolase [Pseudonocardia sp. RS11V-5]|uniref:alpha/beta fold hydrolase n=1 Tax=Pseudonocardia terrae TaxID=2905831 RepID=UPI001E2E18B6|nr:alpha/beta hydrolase [Pseudonocardia terrae]MCE3551610.1 alpha/beta hydrolase [Pseudonocardia terrae]